MESTFTRGQYPQIDPPIMGLGVIVAPFACLGLLPLANAANRRQVNASQARGFIGARSIVGAFACIYGNVHIGEDCRLGDRVTIREGTRIGARCVIGTSVDIQYGALIGDDVKILNGTHIAGGTIIGSGTFIGPGVWTANDRHLQADYVDRGTRQAPEIGKGVFVGVAATILPGVKIGDGARIAAGAVVISDVPAGEVVFGLPAKAREAIQPPARHPFDGR